MPNKPTKQKNFNAFFQTYTPRGAALAAVALLDDAIGALLQSTLKGDAKLLHDMLNGEGSLASLGQKIRVARVIGLLSKYAYDELGKINQIRNAFAHKAEANDFTFPKIQGCASGLAILRDDQFYWRYRHIFVPNGPSAVAQSATSIKLFLQKQGMDIDKPDWAFMTEVTIFTLALQLIRPDTKPLLETPCL